MSLHCPVLSSQYLTITMCYCDIPVPYCNSTVFYYDITVTYCAIALPYCITTVSYSIITMFNCSILCLNVSLHCSMITGLLCVTSVPFGVKFVCYRAIPVSYFVIVVAFDVITVLNLSMFLLWHYSFTHCYH